MRCVPLSGVAQERGLAAPVSLRRNFSGLSGPETDARFCASGLDVRKRSVTVDLAPNADLSPELESRPIYSTSFWSAVFSGCSFVVSLSPAVLKGRASEPTDCAPIPLQGRSRSLTDGATSIVQRSTSFRSPCRPCRPCPHHRVAWLETSSPASLRPLPPWSPADPPLTRHLAVRFALPSLGRRCRLSPGP